MTTVRVEMVDGPLREFTTSTHVRRVAAQAKIDAKETGCLLVEVDGADRVMIPLSAIRVITFHSDTPNR